MKDYSLYLGNCSMHCSTTYIHVGMNSFLSFGHVGRHSNDVHGCTNVTGSRIADSDLEQNLSSLSLLGHSRYLSNLLRQISQTKSPGAILNMFSHGPKGGGQEARNKFYSFMQYPG